MEYTTGTTRARRNFNGFLGTIWVTAMVITSAIAQTLNVPPTLGTHDPSRLIEDQGSYYFYSTSSDVSGYYTTDNGASWKSTGSVLTNGIPSDVLAIVPLSNGHEVWAPDVIYNPSTKLFYLYYSVPSSKTGTPRTNAIALVTSPTLDPKKAVWKNMGPVIDSRGAQYACIDPAPFFDLEGNFWLSFGSQYGGNRSYAINIIALDKTTGLRSDSVVKQVQGCTCEASYVEPHNGYYYLFWNTGGCCSGASSTYTIHIARSTSVTGPFSGNRVFLASTSTKHGPGQIGFITMGGKDYYTYHYYPDSGYSVLGIAPVTWTSSGWPTA